MQLSESFTFFKSQQRNPLKKEQILLKLKKQLILKLRKVTSWKKVKLLSTLRTFQQHFHNFHFIFEESVHESVKEAADTTEIDEPTDLETLEDKVQQEGIVIQHPLHIVTI